MKTTWILAFMLCHKDFLVSGNDHKALIFNQKQNPSLIFIPEESSLQIPCNTWTSACPAETEDEKKFNDTYSLYNAALFLKKNYNQDDFCANILKDRCKEPYKLSMAWFEETIEFGYEMYSENNESVESTFDIHHAPVYNNYEPLKAFLEVEPLTFMDKLKSIHAKKCTKAEKTKLMLKDKEMKFTWIPLFKLWFIENQLRKINYQIRKDNIYPMVKCEDYSLGQELIRDVDVDKMYSRENQKKSLIWRNIVPKTEGHRCEEIYECFTKWLLLPSDQFQFGTDLLSNPKCSNIATVPIWKRTLEKILEKLDVYLYTLSRVFKHTLWVDAGVKGVLKLSHWMHKFLNFRMSLVDDKTKFSIRIPKLIYKLVKFKPKKIQEDYVGSWCGVMIIIHNDPHYKGNKKICKDITDEWGWSEIKFESYNFSNDDKEPSKFIYACKVTKKLVKTVGLTLGYDMLFVDEFSLKKFLVYDDAERAFIRVDVKVKKELMRIYGTGESFKTKDEVIERPSIYDVDFDVSK